ncbi:MAG: pyridoxal phosphate-dependent aminotransferase [Oscillospiraceae bacterium]|nr:pyridoxal phosphate-dependent aminotransferase [Oscillospiraceae bacterium]
MKYDFTTVPDRRGRGSTKWDAFIDSAPDRVPLSTADMEFRTAQPIVDAITHVAQTQVLGYTQGTPAFYDALISWMKRRHNFDVKKEWIVNTPGVVDALAMLIEASTKPGDGVILLSPVYYPFDLAVIAKTRHLVYSDLRIVNGRYEIDFADLEKKAKRKDVTAILFCNPHNPVGRVWTRKELEKVSKICCDNGVFIIDDEIHHDIIMPGHKHIVMSTINERVVNNIAVCTAPSKTFNLAGLQCSNIIIPNEKIRVKAALCNLLNMHSTLNIFAYTACTAAYNHCEEWLDELLTVIKGNADYVKDFLNENFPEIKVFDLEGTYLQWWDMRGLGMTHVEQRRMLEKAGIYLDNGEIFGPAGRGFQRINLACSRQTLEDTMIRLKAAIEAVKAEWKEKGKPYHKTLTVGTKVEGFVYTSTQHKKANLARTVKGNTLIVFADTVTGDLTKATMVMLKTAYPALKAIGCDVKVVLLSPLNEVRAVAEKYPFELIADPDGILYDRYNVFEAEGMSDMIGGDKLVELAAGKEIKKLLDMEMIAAMAGPYLAGGEPKNPQKEEKHVRSSQLNAFIGVDRNMNVIFSHYFRSLTDFPSVKELVKAMKK